MNLRSLNVWQVRRVILDTKSFMWRTFIRCQMLFNDDTNVSCKEWIVYIWRYPRKVVISFSQMFIQSNSQNLYQMKWNPRTSWLIYSRKYRYAIIRELHMIPVNMKLYLWNLYFVNKLNETIAKMKKYLKIIFLIEKYNMNLNKKSKIDNGRNKCHTLTLERLCPSIDG